jgi:uncharacterized membrane protein YdjX (TVP38/TMEM64 family)
MSDDIQNLVDGTGIGAPIAFVVLYALLTIAFVPGSVPSIAAGALFGAVWGRRSPHLARRLARRERS